MLFDTAVQTASASLKNKPNIRNQHLYPMKRKTPSQCLNVLRHAAQNMGNRINILTIYWALFS